MTNGLLSGDDSGLRNTWDEICVQIQLERSFAWDVYEETVASLTRTAVEALQSFEREAIWLQTPEADDWSCEDESERDEYPVVNDDVVYYLLNEKIYPLAANWSN